MAQWFHNVYKGVISAGVPSNTIAVPDDQKVEHEAREGKRRKRLKQAIGHESAYKASIAIPNKVEEANPGAHSDLPNDRRVKWHQIDFKSKNGEICWIFKSGHYEANGERC